MFPLPFRVAMQDGRLPRHGGKREVMVIQLLRCTWFDMVLGCIRHDMVTGVTLISFVNGNAMEDGTKEDVKIIIPKLLSCSVNYNNFYVM